MLAYNLTRAMNITGGQRLMAAMRAWSARNRAEAAAEEASVFCAPSDAHDGGPPGRRFAGWANRQRPQSIAGSVLI